MSRLAYVVVMAVVTVCLSADLAAAQGAAIFRSGRSLGSSSAVWRRVRAALPTHEDRPARIEARPNRG